MQFITRLGLLATLLALIQTAHAATVVVTSFSCINIYFTLTLTPAEINRAQYLSLQAGGQQVSELQFNSAYATQNSYQWYAVFTPEMTGGSQRITFQLLDTNEEPITAFTPVTQTLNFNCGVTVTTTAAASSSPTSGSGNNSGNNANGASNSGSSSGSSSSTGAIAGGVASGVAALLIVGLIAFCMMRKKKNQRPQQSRLRNDEADEATFRAPNNDSTTSLATAPENANTPMMRDVSTKNVFADPTASGVSGAPSGSSTLYNAANSQPGSKPSSGSSVGAAGAGAAAAGGIGAARKQSREQTRARSPSHASEGSPTSEFSKDTPMSQVPPPVPSLPASAPAPYPASKPAAQPAAQTPSPASEPATTANDSSAAPAAAAGAAAAAVAAGAAAKTSSNNKDDKPKTGKWGFKRASKDMGNTSKPPYPQAVPEPINVPAPSSAAASTPSPTSASPEAPASPSRSFKVIQKPTPAPIPSMAGPSSASIAPSESSLNRTPAFPPRSGHATPAGSIRGTNYSRAPSVASMSAGFTEAAPPLPSGAASVASAPAGEFGGNMAGIGAGRSFAASSGNSTKWHQQSYNIMPNFSHRALARSTQLDEDLIFGHLGMGLNPPPGPAGNGGETGSAKSRSDPFGDR